jgi:transposase-like protein
MNEVKCPHCGATVNEKKSAKMYYSRIFECGPCSRTWLVEGKGKVQKLIMRGDK